MNLATSSYTNRAYCGFLSYKSLTDTHHIAWKLVRSYKCFESFSSLCVCLYCVSTQFLIMAPGLPSPIPLFYGIFSCSLGPPWTRPPNLLTISGLMFQFVPVPLCPLELLLLSTMFSTELLSLWELPGCVPQSLNKCLQNSLNMSGTEKYHFSYPADQPYLEISFLSLWSHIGGGCSASCLAAAPLDPEALNWPLSNWVPSPQRTPT